MPMPIEDISLWPKLSSPAHLRIQGGPLSVTEKDGRKLEVLVSNIGFGEKIPQLEDNETLKCSSDNVP